MLIWCREKVFFSAAFVLASLVLLKDFCLTRALAPLVFVSSFLIRPADQVKIA